MEKLVTAFLMAAGMVQLFLEQDFLALVTGAPRKRRWIALAAALFRILLHVVPAERLHPFDTALHFLFLVFSGCVLLKQRALVSAVASVIAMTVTQLSNLLFGSLLFALLSLPDSWRSAGLNWAVMVLLTICPLVITAVCYVKIVRIFPVEDGSVHRYALLALTPLLLVFFLGDYVSGTVYGNTLVINDSGVFPHINHVQIFGMLCLALASLFSVMFACRRLSERFEERTRLALLEQEARLQREYVAEAKARYDQTRAFRHDFKNHLLVLEGLLETGNTGRAAAYLRGLDGIAAQLSFACQTNHAALDILLGSKLGVAARGGVQVACGLEVPNPCSIDDMDLCIVCSNALDNAIAACSEMGDAPNRYIRVGGERQGSFFMVEVENSCTARAKGIRRGTGLSNIEAVAAKYGGTVSIERHSDRFRLSVLFLIS